MATPSWMNSKKFSVFRSPLGQYFDENGKFDPSSNPQQFQALVNTLKTEHGFTDDDLKPLLDSATSAGYNVGPDYAVTKADANIPATYTPAKPAVTPTIPTVPIPGPQDGTSGSNPAPQTNPGPGNTGSPNGSEPTYNPVNLPTPQPLIQPIPGYIDPTSDRGAIEGEGQREAVNSQNALANATGVRQRGLLDLGTSLQKRNQAQFNYDLPGIKEDLQNSGLFSSPSALAAAVTRESGMLGANTAATLANYGYGNTQQEASGMQGIADQQNQFQQGGLQRQFSVADYNKQAQLAREIGASSVPNAPGFSLGGALSGASTGAIGSAGLWAANPGIAAAITGLSAISGGGRGGSGGSCFLIGHLFKMKIIKRKEAFNVHLKLSEVYERYRPFFHVYYAIAPMFVLQADKDGFDWKGLKPKIVDEILTCDTSEEAFVKFFSICKELFHPLFPEIDSLLLKIGDSYGC